MIILIKWDELNCLSLLPPQIYILKSWCVVDLGIRSYSEIVYAPVTSSLSTPGIWEPPRLVGLGSGHRMYQIVPESGQITRIFMLLIYVFIEVYLIFSTTLVSGVHHSDSNFLWVIIGLKFLRNTGCRPSVVQYSLGAVLFHT